MVSGLDGAACTGMHKQMPILPVEFGTLLHSACLCRTATED